MNHQTFLAFSSADPLITDTISEACKLANSAGREFLPWNLNDVSGQPIDRSVYSWVEKADALVADISSPNHNVTYEIGLAIGMLKPARLIRSTNKDRKLIEEIGLLHNIGHLEYGSRLQLTDILRKPYVTPSWPLTTKNNGQPLYLLQSSQVDEILSRTTSGIKKIMKFRFRNFNPREIDRLTASEAFEQISQSFGVVAIWHEVNASEAFRQNQRAAFAAGVARGLDIPLLLIAHQDMRLPLDLDEIAARFANPSDIDEHLRKFRETVAETQESYVEVRATNERYLSTIHCGDPAAENEASNLDDYFLETEQFRLTLNGDLNVILGRKGSGKTAIFLQARDKTRANKNNIVVDLAPEGFQLVKLKEFILSELAHGTRKEFIAAFWEYIIWLEIAYKILEKDVNKTKYDSRLLPHFERLEKVYKERVDGTGDFSERLSGLTERIVERYNQQKDNVDNGTLSSSKVLEVIYGSEIRTMRDEVLRYLKLKGIVFFLFDNLDRFWTPTGFADIDAYIIIGLIECLQDIRKRFDRAALSFLWAIFLRSDVYEFIVKGMADYGKLPVSSVEWNDKELLLKMFENRILQGFGKNPPSWSKIWGDISVPKVGDVATLDFLVDSSLSRPRYLIRLFETARRRAVTLGRDKIEENDYKMALEELGWQVLEDFDRELSDVVPDAEQLLFDIAQLGNETSLSALKAVIAAKITAPSRVDAVVDVLIWTGCIGIKVGSTVKYISDVGFKRPFLKALIKNDDDNFVSFHPTVASIFG